MILDERGFSGFEEWADRVCRLLEPYGNPPTIISAKDWRTWASVVCRFPRISGQQPPNPDHFANWRAWVQSFNQAVTLPTG